jgi:hypothetical protein
MPSYRIVLTIGVLRPGTEPQSLLPLAAGAARRLAVVEAFDVGVVSGAARITVRFTADDREAALRIGGAVVTEVQRAADVNSRMVTERVGGRWIPIGT